MPRVLVLFSGPPETIGPLADAIADGAGSVKFTEVEVRRIDEPALSHPINAEDKRVGDRTAAGRRYRALQPDESVAAYDALIVATGADLDPANPMLTQILNEAALPGGRALMDKVASAFSPALTSRDVHEARIMSMLTPMMRLGMIIVPPSASDPALDAQARSRGKEASGESTSPTAADLATAQEQGARVAKVAEWVRHAKSHEAHRH